MNSFMRNFYLLNIVRPKIFFTRATYTLFSIAFFLLPFFNSGYGQSITVTNVVTTPVCAGSDVTISFNVTNGAGAANYYTNSTFYRVYLSDASGNNLTPTGTPFNVSATYSVGDGGNTLLTATFAIPVGTATGSA
ncbi:MAG: hypothetical protein KGM98_03205, partial [Bacteroidota bacterium]|nr:hypothetical protein [Bacteroidota bacterium]